MSNCDPNQLPAYITPIDINNAYKYASNKLLFTKMNAYLAQQPGTIAWRPSFSDNSVSYNCPVGLTCYEGQPIISTKQECLSQSVYDVNIDPTIQKNYLEWDNKNCYLGNYSFRQGCDTNFATTSETSRGVGDLYWDSDTNRCLMTQKYCQSYGNDNYSGGDANGNGGTCNLSQGKTVAEALFGNTITNFFGGNC
jgi:hypothetical protein